MEKTYKISSVENRQVRFVDQFGMVHYDREVVATIADADANNEIQVGLDIPVNVDIATISDVVVGHSLQAASLLIDRLSTED